MQLSEENFFCTCTRLWLIYDILWGRAVVYRFQIDVCALWGSLEEIPIHANKKNVDIPY